MEIREKMMDKLLKCEILLDELAKALVEENEKQAYRVYQEYQELYQKITGEKFQTTFEELKNKFKNEL